MWDFHVGKRRRRGPAFLVSSGTMQKCVSGNRTIEEIRISIERKRALGREWESHNGACTHNLHSAFRGWTFLTLPSGSPFKYCTEPYQYSGGRGKEEKWFDAIPAATRHYVIKCVRKLKWWEIWTANDFRGFSSQRRQRRMPQEANGTFIIPDVSHRAPCHALWESYCIFKFYKQQLFQADGKSKIIEGEKRKGPI